MKNKCFMSDCENKPYGKCDCDENHTVFCQIHILQHLENQTETKRHRCLRLYYTPAQETKILVKNKTSELIKGLRQYRKNLILDSKVIIEALMKTLEMAIKNLKELEERLFKLNLIAELDEVFDLSSTNDPENVLKMKPADAEFEMSEWYFPDFDPISAQIASKMNTYFDSNINPFQPSIMRHDEYIFFKSNNGKKLSQINLQTFKEIKYETDLKEDDSIQFSDHVQGNVRFSACMLPDRSVFYYTNSQKYPAFIIDKNKSIKQFVNIKPNSGGVCIVYCDGFIYVFGNLSIEYKKFTEKYCLKTNMWESFPLPVGLNLNPTQAVLFRNHILLAGISYPKLVKYNPKNNNFSDVIGLKLTENSGKIVFKGNKKVYVLEHAAYSYSHGSLFESGENNMSVWNSVGNNSIDSNYNCPNYFVEYNGCIYMMLNKSQQNHLFEFNLQSKKMNLVKEYNKENAY